ncbi:MAG: polysaccharide biosynthesis C-terminal domain-containing protein [Elusimicrobia bacterium]|nr:polysaccharide biosynthesis C-terminal domain-containing protein [Elusimicrobiota bacterium]
MKVADAAGFASNVYRHLAFLLTIAAALAAVMIGPAVRLLYGAAYLPLVIPFQFLLTGTVSLGLARVLIDYFNATGTTLRIIWVFGLAIILNTALNFLFISRWQIAGAAAASSITHLGTITVLSCLFLKTSGLPVRSFIPTHEDWKFYKKALTGSLVRSYMKRV